MKFSSIEAHLPKLPQKLWRWISFVLAAVVVANLAIAFNSQRTVAADRIIFFYGPIEASVPYVELEAFAQTGAISPSVRDIVRVSGGDEDLIRDVLTEELSVDLIFLDKAANHIMGRFLLAQIGEVIFPPSGLERVKALRAALILSAADDERISLLEIFKNYPTNMRINARGLLEISDELQVLARGGQKALEFIRSSIFYDIICPSSQRVALKSADDAGAIAADTVSCASRNAATRNASAS